jgi:Asp-tRNA(Asn)/Glu-tRNA(Gln) amidotransferase A subunit family amidase
MDLPTRHAIPQLNASPAPATDAPAQTARSAPAATAGAPPAFGTATPAGPSIEPSDFEHAEKLMQVSMTPAERGQAAGNWSISMASLVERRTGPRKVPLEHSLAPASVWKPLLSGLPKYPVPVSKSEDVQTYSKVTDSLPLDDVSIAYSPVTHLSHWIATRQITSERLCSIYLDRLKRYDPLLRCVITLTEEHAMEQARVADREIAAGRYLGILHGIPYGAKDLLDTAGIASTYGAEPYRHRVPEMDSAVIHKLNAAGAVLVAKLSLGALALNDIWFGGQTMNPWLLEEGASGSSAGSGAAVAAGLVGFAIGSETEGSIIAPSMRCGVTGLRPTFGRVPRTGAMTLAWSMDKLGPMTRSVEDTMLVLQAIRGADAGDAASVDAALPFDAAKGANGLRIGYFPHWMEEPPATHVDRHALAVARELGMTPVEVSLPDWPYGNLNTILFAEATAAFEEFTLSNADDQLQMQVPDAWPNIFRQARFLSAVDYVQAERMRRKVATEMNRVMSQVDLLLVPSLRDEILTITNFTGHPSLTLRAGFVEVSEARSDWAPDPDHPRPSFDPPRRVPHGITLIGNLFDEATIVQAGAALEQALDVARERPDI